MRWTATSAEQAWRLRWGALLSCTAAPAVADTFLELPGSVGADRDTPTSHGVCGVGPLRQWLVVRGATHGVTSTDFSFLPQKKKKKNPPFCCLPNSACQRKSKNAQSAWNIRRDHFIFYRNVNSMWYCLFPIKDFRSRPPSSPEHTWTHPSNPPCEPLWTWSWPNPPPSPSLPPFPAPSPCKTFNFCLLPNCRIVQSRIVRSRNWLKSKLAEVEQMVFALFLLSLFLF